MERATHDPGTAATVILAEDDDELRELLTNKLESQGAEVVACRTGTELVEQLDRAFGAAGSGDVDLVVTDIRMPGVTGLSVLSGLNAFGRSCPVILMTAFGDEATYEEAERLHATAVFDKPFDVDELLQRAWSVIERERRLAGAWHGS